ncbi:MAG: hypothetical protein ABJP48_04770 [Erythrobacter sp.]
MTIQFADLARRVREDGVVASDELLSLRQQGWGDGIITQEEAEAIFAINNVLDQRDDAWSDFFVEAIGEFVLNGTKPRRQCNAEETEWLIAQIDHDGVIESFVELEALVRIVERAENVTDRLKNYLLEQIEREVMTGTGPARNGGELSDTHISPAECKILRRVIFASGGFGPAAVSRFDAEMLFRLKDATLADANAPEWADLFVDGVANYLGGFTIDNAQLSHDRKLELVEFLEKPSAGLEGFVAKMIETAPKLGRNINWAVEHLGGKDGPQNDYGADASAGDIVTEDENNWLQKMAQGDGKLDDIERKLLKRLVEDSPV